MGGSVNSQESHGPCLFCYKNVDICDVSGDLQKRRSAARQFFIMTAQLFRHQAKLPNHMDFYNLVQLCEDCFKIVGQFCSMYHQLRCLELQLSWKVETLEDLMKSADRVSSRVNSFREGMKTIIESEEFGGDALQGKCNEIVNNLMEVRRGLIKQCSSHLSSCVPKLILYKCDVEVLESEKSPAGDGDIVVTSDENGDNIPAYFIGWLYSIVAVVLLSQGQEDNTRRSAWAVAQTEIEDLAEVGRNTNTDEDFDGVGAIGKQIVGALGIKSETETEEDEDFADEHDYDDGNSVTIAAESEPASPPSVEISKTREAQAAINPTPMECNTVPRPPEVMNKISIEQMKGALEKVVQDAKLKLKVEQCENSGTSEVKQQHVRRSLRTIHKCTICHSTFSNFARLKLHQGSCQKDPDAAADNNSDGEGGKVALSSLPPEEKQSKMEDQEWEPIGGSDPRLSSDDEMDYSEPEPDSKLKKEEEASSTRNIKTQSEDAIAVPQQREKLTANRRRPRPPPKPVQSTSASPLPSEDLEFKCLQCPKTFRKKFLLKAHIAYCQGPGHSAKMTPDGCTFREFVYKHTAKFHCQTDKCLKKYHTQEELDNHSKLHGSFPCSLCDQVKKFAPDLAIHEASHTEKTGRDGEPNTFYCSRCPYKICRKAIFVVHFLKTHLGMCDNMKCPLCGVSISSFQSKKRLVNQIYMHFWTHHGLSGADANDDLFKCEKCPAYFLQPTQLDRHNRMHVATSEKSKSYQCQDCGKGFKCGSHLSRHRTQVHKVEAKLACAEEGCERLFETVFELEKHKQYAHSWENPLLQCSVCGKKCLGAVKLRRHEATHNEQYLKDSRIACDQCGKTFRDNGRLQIHLLTHSGPESWKFTCEICGKKCITQQKLDEHQRTHTKAKPFVCETCGQAYAHRHNLRIHVNNKHAKKDVPREYNKHNLVSKKKTLKKEDG